MPDLAPVRIFTHLVITGEHCRFCSRLIPQSIAHLYGNEAAGYICPECVIKQEDDRDVFGRQLTEECTREILSPGSPWGCAMCATVEPDTYREVVVDNAVAHICLVCEPKWIRLNREKLGPVAQFKLKLK